MDLHKPAWLASIRPLYAALLLGLVLLGAWGLWPRAVRVEVAQVATGPLQTGFTEEGRTRLRDRFLISAPVDGVVERIALEAGDAVKVGAPVAVLRPAASSLLDPATRADAEMRWRTAGDERIAAQASVAAAAAARDQAAAALRRGEALASKQQISADQRDELHRRSAVADAEWRSAQARLQAATTRRTAAREWLDLQGSSNRTPIRLSLPSPVDGRVMRRHVESEGLVRAGQALLEIGDPALLEVIVEVLTSDAMQLQPGMPVRLDSGTATAPTTGRVLTIEPGAFTKVSALGVEEQRVVVVVALPEGAPSLGDGYRVDAQFEVWAAQSALTVPVPALFRDGANWAVYVVDNGRARLRRVGIGHIGESAAEVTGGLASGDRVVVYPGDRVRDGMRIAF
jgi:HlyD family secretion protein